MHDDIENLMRWMGKEYSLEVMTDTMYNCIEIYLLKDYASRTYRMSIHEMQLRTLVDVVRDMKTSLDIFIDSDEHHIFKFKKGLEYNRARIELIKKYHPEKLV